MEGTSLVRFKSALITKINTELSAGTVTAQVAYDSPQTPEDILGASGNGVACWFADEADISYEVEVMKGSPVWLDETVEAKFRIQAIGQNTDDTQATVDARANTVLGHVIALLQKDSSVGLADDDIETFTALPGPSAQYFGGKLNDQRAARFELSIEIQARLKLTASA